MLTARAAIVATPVKSARLTVRRALPTRPGAARQAGCGLGEYAVAAGLRRPASRAKAAAEHSVAPCPVKIKRGRWFWLLPPWRPASLELSQPAGAAAHCSYSWSAELASERRARLAASARRERLENRACAVSLARNLTVALAPPLCAPQAKPKASVRRVVSMSHAVKIYDTCIGCTQCVRACPTDVLEMVPWDGCRAGQIASAPRTEDCVGCKRCEAACPTDFLSVRVYLGAETTRSMGLAY